MKQTKEYMIVTEIKCLIAIPIKAASKKEAAEKYRLGNFEHYGAKVAAVTGKIPQRGLSKLVKIFRKQNTRSDGPITSGAVLIPIRRSTSKNRFDIIIFYIYNRDIKEKGD